MRAGTTIWRALERGRRMDLAERGLPAPVAGHAGQTRRSVLKALGAAGALPFLPRTAQARLPRGAKVAIIGAGIAGLSALHHLAEDGVEARIYEARGRTGGRMFTARTADGGRIEDGGQLVNTDHADMHALARAYGIGLIDRKGGTHRTLILADGRALQDDTLVEALRPIAAQIARDSEALDKDYDRVAPALDRLSIKDYLDRHAALLPQSWVRGLLEATSRTEYGVEPDQASAIELIFNLPTVDGQHIEVLGESDERFVIEGGSGSLIAAMTARFGDRIETGKRLTRIDPRGAGVRLTFLDDSHADADAAIVAVPAPLTRQIGFGVELPPLWRRFIAEMGLGRCEKLHQPTTARPWLPTMGYGGELWQTEPRHGYALGWDGGIGPADRPASVWTWFLGGAEIDALDDRPIAELAGQFLAATEGAIPGLTGAASGPLRRTAWHRDSLTLGAYSNFPPGQLSRYAGLLWIESDDPAERQTALAGRIAFAGEHLSDAYPGYMNGAAQTGRLAAQALVGTAIHARAA